MNRKGITTIELLLCFVIVMIITVSMYATVSAYNDRRIIESYKEQITNYKNTLTKDIQDDLIKIGVSSATYERTVTNSQYKTSLPKVMAVYTVNLELRDGSKRKLIIEQTLTKSSYHPAGYKATGGGQEVDDYFMIKYGDPDAMIEYKLPDLGSYTSEETGKTALDFSINNVLINIYDEKVLSIYIGFYHPEFGTRYCIDITALVDFSFTGAEFVNQKKVQFFILWNLNGGGYTGGLSPNPRGYDQTMLPLGPFTAPKLDNYTFTGWTGSNGTTPQMDYVIPRGTTGSLSFRANYRPNRLIFRYKLGAGEQLTPHTEKQSENKKFDWTVDADGYIKVSVNEGAVNYTQHVIDFTQTTLDLNNYNNTEGLNITKPAYVAVSGKQWKCLSGCLSTSVTLNQASGSVTPSSICNYKDADCNIALGVNWRPVDYTITYDYAGGNATNPATYNIETNTFTLNTPSRTGYDFAGWTGTGITGTASTVTITKGSTGDRSYTATWNIKKFNITYNANGGTGTMNPTTCNYNATCTLAANAFSKNGNTFAGWYTAASGGTKYNATTTLTSNITVYAHWAPVEMEKTFDYTGNVVSYTISAPGKYKFEVWGAQGGNNGESGGKGGYAVGYVNVTDTLTVYVVVGGRGKSDTACDGGGYNGGGNAGCNGTSGAGGGATHIAKTNRGVLSNYSSHKTDLYIVAGGGGGAGCNGCPGGYGGGSSGQSKSGGGGTQSGGGSGGPAGAFGIGGSRNGDGGGGGGGYYGGGASSVDCGGGGGSGYIGGVTGGSTTGDQKTGNGYAKISFVE